MDDKFTILVNSCDKYEDLWFPFFTLLKKYWNPLDVRLILNTETKVYHMDGLNIECIHPQNPNVPYGERMINVLSKIRTPYVIPLLDDFFLRKRVDIDMIYQIIKWMEEDKNIVYFNCDYTPVYADWENGKYPGFRRIPYGNVYTLNMQAAVWRTEKLLKYWKPNVSPWDWEELCNLSASRNKKEKFYCVSAYGQGFCDYGYDLKGMGVHHGKWVYKDVIPLFEKEKIQVDFSKRGFLEVDKKSDQDGILRESLKKIKVSSDIINRCLDQKDKVIYILFVMFNCVLRQYKLMPELQYVHFSLLKERKKFYKRIRMRERLVLLKKEGIIRIIQRKIGMK